jgi:2-dehydropantoate 2-reductase
MLSVGIFGAGAVGCYVGIRLSAGGVPVTLVGRGSAPRPLAAVTLGGERAVARHDLVWSNDPAALAAVHVCFVCVKSQDTEIAGRALAPLLRPETVVFSLQNGLGNAARLGLHGAQSAMITFNVVNGADGFRQATSGPLVCAPPPRFAAELRDAFAAAGEPLSYRSDMEAVLATKLLINLFNGICALAGLPTAAALRERELRRVFAACIREGLAVYRAAGVRTARIGRISPRLAALLLPLPDGIVLRAAPALVAVDPAARSSTLQDVDRGKPTEIDWLNGAIVDLAARAGVSAPVNAAVVRAVHELERTRRFLPVSELVRLLVK